MDRNADAIRAALASLVGAPNSSPLGFMAPYNNQQQQHQQQQHQQQQQQQHQQHHQTQQQFTQPLAQQRHQHQQQQHQHQQLQPPSPSQQQPHVPQQQQPLSSVKDALISIREKLLSLQSKQQLQQDSLARQTMAIFGGCPSSPGQQQPQPQEEQQRQQQQGHSSPLQAVAINAQELERIQQQQQLLVSFLHKRLQLESQQQQQQQQQLLHQQQPQPHEQQPHHLQQQLLHQQLHQQQELLLQCRISQQHHPQQQHWEAAEQLGAEIHSSTRSSLPRDPSTCSSALGPTSNGLGDTAGGRQQTACTTQGSTSSTAAAAAAAAGASCQMPSLQLLQAGDYTTLQLLKAAKLKPKVEGVCFDKYFRRWVAKKSGTKKVYFPVQKHGFDRAYELAVQTRMVHLQHTKQNAAAEGAASALPSPHHLKDEMEGQQAGGGCLSPRQEMENLRGLSSVKSTGGFAFRGSAKNKRLPQLIISECSGPDACAAQEDGHEGNAAAPHPLSQQQQQQGVEPPQDSQGPAQATELGRAGDETLRDSTSIAPTPPASPLDKKGMGDTAERPSTATGTAGGGGLLSQGPTAAEALRRLSLFRLDKLDIESPVNPEKAPRDAIRVAEALAPFPPGIRFDKSTFRWFALFRDKATGAKRAKTFTAKMYDGCVVKAYEACLRFCSCHVIKSIEGARPLLLDCTTGVALPDDSFYAWRGPADADGMATPTRTPREDTDNQDIKGKKRLQQQGDDTLYDKRRAYWATQMEALWQRSVRGANRKGTEGSVDGSGLKPNRALLLASPSSGPEVASPARSATENAPASPRSNAERDNSLALPPTDRDDLSETTDLLESLLPGRSSRRRSRRIAGGKRRRHPLARVEEGLFRLEAERPTWSVSSVEQALMEGGRQYCHQSSSSLPFGLTKPQINSNGSFSCCCCCSECEHCSEQQQCSRVPFCLQCLPTDTRQMLRQVLLICFDGMADLVLKRFNYSKTDRWRRWLAVRLHREKVAEAALWHGDAHCAQPSEAPPTPSPSQERTQGGDVQVEEDAATTGWDKQQQQKHHECWGDLIPYVHLFWPFIEHQEVPSNLDLCVVSELMQQLHALAARKPQLFKGYPLLSEAERHGGDFALQGGFYSESEGSLFDMNIDQQPFFTLGSGSPLYE